MEQLRNAISSSSDSRVIKLFCVVGLNEHKITKYVEDDTSIRYIQKIDIIQKKLRVNLDQLDYKNEKWYIFILKIKII